MTPCQFCRGEDGPNPVMPGRDMCETCYGWWCEDQAAELDAEAAAEREMDLAVGMFEYVEMTDNGTPPF